MERPASPFFSESDDRSCYSSVETASTRALATRPSKKLFVVRTRMFLVTQDPPQQPNLLAQLSHRKNQRQRHPHCSILAQHGPRRMPTKDNVTLLSDKSSTRTRGTNTRSGERAVGLVSSSGSEKKAFSETIVCKQEKIRDDITICLCPASVNLQSNHLTDTNNAEHKPPSRQTLSSLFRRLRHPCIQSKTCVQK